MLESNNSWLAQLYHHFIIICESDNKGAKYVNGHLMHCSSPSYDSAS